MARRPSKQELAEHVAATCTAQYERGLASPFVKTGLATLHDTMAAAAQAYALGPQHQRQAVCDSIIAVCKFLKKQGFQGKTIEPLNRALLALVEVDQNAPDPLFCEKPDPTKSRRRAEDAIKKGHIAALAKAWLDAEPAGLKRQKLERAARKMSGAYFGELTATGIDTALKYASRSEREHPLVGMACDQMRNSINAAFAENAHSSGVSRTTIIETQIQALNLTAQHSPFQDFDPYE